MIICLRCCPAYLLGLWVGLLSAGATQAQSPPPVEIAVAEQTHIIEAVRLSGTLTAKRRARLSPEVAGRVAKLDVDAGDRVTAGQILLQLDDELAELALAQAKAVRRESAAALADARRRLGEAQDLAKDNSVADTEVRSLEAEVETDTAVLARREAEQAQAAARLRQHRLRAPFTGVITARLTDLGEWVTPGEPVLELVAVDRLRLELRVPQTYFGRVDQDTLVHIYLDALPGEPLEQTVDDWVPANDPGTRTFLARLNLDNRDGHLAPGMSARAIVRIGTGREGVVIPRDALIRHPDGRVTVWIAAGEGEQRTVQEQRVVTDLAFDGKIAIREGVEVGMPVVVRGNETLQPGQTVRVVGDD